MILNPKDLDRLADLVADRVVHRLKATPDQATRNGDDLLSIKELGQLVGMKPRTVWRKVSEGIFPAPIAIGRLKKWPRRIVMGWVEEREQFTGGRAAKKESENRA